MNDRPKRRVLITGATGFVGSHLMDYLMIKDNCEVWGTKRHRSSLANLTPDANLVECDITDYSQVATTLRAIFPDDIYHLAAQSFVPTSWMAPYMTMRTNVIGTLNILEAARSILPEARILIAGSSEEYGFVKPDECPITEAQPLRPMSPYGVSKIAADMLGQQYARSYTMHIVITRAFNHTGPRRGAEFVCSNFARQIALIEKGLQEPVIKVGNLMAKRDFTDVRDTVRAYVLALEKCPPGRPFNIASGETHTIESVLDTLATMSKASFAVRRELSRMRPSDVPLLQGDSTALRTITGWQPKIPFEQTLEDLLNYWRRRV